MSTGIPKHHPDQYFVLEDSDSIILCGECLDKDLLATWKDDLVGDERVTVDNVSRLSDDQTFPYQCDGCNKQNVPYEQMGYDENGVWHEHDCECEECK